MKKFLSIIFILLTSILLIACDEVINDTNNKTHVVAIYDEHGELINNYFVVEGKLFDESLLETLIPKGETFTFKFWSEELEGTEFLFTTPINNNINLYPVIEGRVDPKPTYTVTVLGTSGEQIAKITVEQGLIFEKAMIEGHLNIENQENFDKWVIDGTSTEYTFTEAITSNITIRAMLHRDINASFDVTLYNGYYQGVGLNEYVDRQLITNLKTAIRRNYNPGSYKSSNWATLKLSDIHPTKPGYVWGIYDSKAIGVNNHGGNVGQWNKEHVVPQSWLKDAGLSGYGDDQHNLRASDMQENSRRNNLKFVDSDGSFGRTSGGYYPGDDHKGDVARILMYMLVIHDGSTLTIDKMFVTGADWDTLLKWHLEDPVDNFEINRNNVIHDRQGNRNPFIDYPDLVYFVWNNQYGELIN